MSEDYYKALPFAIASRNLMGTLYVPVVHEFPVWRVSALIKEEIKRFHR